jgi:4-hydroxy-3-methylbut-2-en-1-yl diphosphate synthase IspG/GcpE
MHLGLLREAGIICHLKDEYTVTIDPLLSPALGGMKLMVDEHDVERAKALLQESDNRYLETVTCPRCHQTGFTAVTEVTRFNNWKSKLKSILLTGQQERVKHFFRCNHCHTTFSEVPGDH